MLQDMVLAAVNEGIRAAQERAESKMGGIAGGLGCGGLGLPGDVSIAARLRSTAWSPSSASCRASASAPRSGSPSTSCAPSDDEAFALADAIREVKEKIGLCETLLQPRRGAALPDLRRPAPEPRR